MSKTRAKKEKLFIIWQNQLARKQPGENVDFFTEGIAGCIVVILQNKEGRASFAHVDSTTDPTFIFEEAKLMGDDFSLTILYNPEYDALFRAFSEFILKGNNKEIKKSNKFAVKILDPAVLHSANGDTVSAASVDRSLYAISDHTSQIEEFDALLENYVERNSYRAITRVYDQRNRLNIAHPPKERIATLIKSWIEGDEEVRGGLIKMVASEHKKILEAANISEDGKESSLIELVTKLPVIIKRYCDFLLEYKIPVTEGQKPLINKLSKKCGVGIEPQYYYNDGEQMVCRVTLLPNSLNKESREALGLEGKKVIVDAAQEAYLQDILPYFNLHKDARGDIAIFPKQDLKMVADVVERWSAVVGLEDYKKYLAKKSLPSSSVVHASLQAVSSETNRGCVSGVNKKIIESYK